MDWSKYIKPRSLTWWVGGVLPVLGGLAVAFEPVHGLASLSESIRNATGGLTGHAMIWSGLTIIGIRGAFVAPKEGGA